MEEIEVKAEKGENTNCGHICAYRQLQTFRDARAGTGMYVTLCRVTTAETNCRNARLQHQHGACQFGDFTPGPEPPDGAPLATMQIPSPAQREQKDPWPPVIHRVCTMDEPCAQCHGATLKEANLPASSCLHSSGGGYKHGES